MFFILKCDVCGKTGDFPFTINWNYERKCKDCLTWRTKTYNFCSDKCMFKFAERFVGHKHDWKWEMPKHKRVCKETFFEQQTCSVCGMRQWRMRK